MWVRSLGREDLLEEGMATYSSILVWRISWTEEPGRPQSVAAAVAAKLFQSCLTLCDPVDGSMTGQASPSLGFSRQEHRSGLSFSSPMHESEK